MMLRRVSGAAVAALTVLTAAAAVAQVVVVESHGPSSSAYPSGAMLAPSQMLNLKAGDRVELMDASGTRWINGPASVRAGQGGGAQASLKDIFDRANRTHSGVAAVRGFELTGDQKPPAPPPAPLWTLDVSAWQQGEPLDNHDFCVPAGAAPALSRASEQAEGHLEIAVDGASSSVQVVWPAGAKTLAWPASLPVHDGATYALNLDAAGATQVRWRVLPASKGLVEMAKAMLDDACYDQLDSLKALTGTTTAAK